MEARDRRLIIVDIAAALCLAAGTIFGYLGNFTAAWTMAAAFIGLGIYAISLLAARPPRD
jgi:hypothetical protein